MSTARRSVKSAKLPIPPRQSLPLLMMQAFHYSRRAFDEAVRPYGVTASQLGVLTRIASQPGISGAELARLMFTTPQAAQLALAALERMELVERTPDPAHGRIVRSVLTAAGRQVLDDCAADALAVEQHLCAALDEQEHKSLVDLLERYIHHSASE